MANANDGASGFPKPGMSWIVASAVCAVSVAGLYAVSAFRAVFETQQMLGVFKSFGAKMPLPTQFLLHYRNEVGIVCLLVALGMVVKECLPIRLELKMAVNAACLCVGCVVFALVQVALSMPMTAIMQSLMGGGPTP